MAKLRQITMKISLIACVTLATLGNVNAKTNQQGSDAVETIEVKGERTLAYYRTQMESAEVAFYDEFNKHVKKSKYKVVCKDEPRADSYRITQKACYPMYFIEKKSDMVKKARQSGAPLPSNQQVEAELKHEKDKSLMYAEKLVKKHPELRERLVEMYKTKQIFKRAEEVAKR